MSAHTHTRQRGPNASYTQTECVPLPLLLLLMSLFFSLLLAFQFETERTPATYSHDNFDTHCTACRIHTVTTICALYYCGPAMAITGSDNALCADDRSPLIRFLFCFGFFIYLLLLSPQSPWYGWCARCFCGAKQQQQQSWKLTKRKRKIVLITWLYDYTADYNIF